MRPPPGSAETIATSWTAVPLAELVRRLGCSADPARPSVVAVDGRGAGGKTSFAARLHDAIPGSAVVHTDDIAWNHSIFAWVDELVDGVLGPVRRGEAVSYRPPGWISRDRPGAVEVPAHITTLIVEGVGSGRRALAAHLDAVVWVQSDTDDAYARGIVRDIADPERANGDEVEARRSWDEWMVEELPFLEAEATWDRADVIVAGQPVIPLGRDEVAVADPAHSSPPGR